MIFYILSKLITMCFGMLYPAYSSYKAIKSKNAKEYVQWMMYWIVFAVYSILESFSDALLGSWFPFYYELKICFMFWMLSPTTKGGSILYRRYVHPALCNHEKEIDGYLAEAKRTMEGMLAHWGSRAISYAYDSFLTFVLRLPQITRPHIQKNPSRRELSQGPFSPSLEIIDVTHDSPLPNYSSTTHEDSEDCNFGAGLADQVLPPSSVKRRVQTDKVSNEMDNDDLFLDSCLTKADGAEEKRSSIPPYAIRKEARLAKQLKKRKEEGNINITTNSLRSRSRKIQ